MRIGILDSGLGGLTVLKPLIDLTSSLECFYYADSAYCPYGDKSDNWINERCRHFLDLFAKHDIKAAVIACNSATASGIEKWREDYDFPIFGIEPFLNILDKRPELKEKKINLLTTARTASSQKFQTLQSLRDPEGKIQVWPCPGLAELIENKRVLEAKDLEEWGGLKNASTGEVWILGCTHYPLIAKTLENYLQGEVVEAGLYVAQNIVKQIAPTGRGKVISFATSGGDILDFAKKFLNPQADPGLICRPWPQK